MSEVRTIMTPIQVDMACECIVGFMRPTGVSLLSHPPKYEHKCNNCGHIDAFENQYPYMTFQHSDDVEVE